MDRTRREKGRWPQRLWAILEEHNHALKLAAASGVSAECPNELGNLFVNADSRARAEFLSEGLGPSSHVLVVGDAYGREYYNLRAQGCQVTALNLTTSSLIPDVVVGDVSTTLPFDQSTFDAVIASEVIEHLIDDARALREIRRVLRPTGSLRITVPFYHDAPNYHVRIHSPKSITRLLEATGFRVDELRLCGAMWPVVKTERALLRGFGIAARLALGAEM